MNKAPYFYFFIFCFLILSCSAPPQVENPEWVDALISEYESQPLGEAPPRILKYTVNGSDYYYIPAPCCDQFNILLDGTGNAICAPDGGFTGNGTGDCPEFAYRLENPAVVWEDSRSSE